MALTRRTQDSSIRWPTLLPLSQTGQGSNLYHLKRFLTVKCNCHTCGAVTSWDLLKFLVVPDSYVDQSCKTRGLLFPRTLREEVFGFMVGGITVPPQEVLILYYSSLLVL